MTIEPKSPVTLTEALNLHAKAKEPSQLDWQCWAGMEPNENPLLLYRDDCIIIYSHIPGTRHIINIHVYPLSETESYDHWWQWSGINDKNFMLPSLSFELINWAPTEPEKKRTIFVHKLVFKLEADESESVYAEFTSPEPFVDDRAFDEIANALERLHGKLVKDWRNGNHPIHTWFRDGDEMGGG